MNPAKVRRDHLQSLTDLPNIGPAMAGDLESIGIKTPQELRGKDPYDLYLQLCQQNGARQDPCVLDVFISITRFISGDKPRPWWDYTEERKRSYGSI